MEIRTYVLLIALGAALATIVPRVLPLVALSRIELPAWLRSWLGHVPVAILAALLATELLLAGGQPVPLGANPALLAILPAFAIAAWKKSIIGAVLAGVAAMALLRALGHG